MTNSRRTFLKTVGLAVGTSGVAATVSGSPQSSSSSTENDGETTADGWTHGRYGPQNTAYKPDGPTTTGFESAWQLDRSTNDFFEPVVADGTVYLQGEGDFSGTLYALDPADGTVEWNVDTPAPREIPTVAGGNVYLPTAYGLKAYSAADGSVQWTYDSVQDDVNADATGVYVDTGPAIVALDHDGTERWRYEVFDKGVMSKPAVAEGTVVVGYRGTDGGHVLALDAETGEKRWSKPGAGMAPAPVTVRNGRAFAPVEGRESGDVTGVAAFALETGEELWRIEYDEYSEHEFVVADDAVYTVTRTDQSRILKLDAGSGEQQASWAVGDVTTSPTAAGDTLYVTTTVRDATGEAAPVVYAIDRQSGVVRAAQSHGESSEPGALQAWQGSPVIADGQLYVGSRWEDDSGNDTIRLSVFELTESEEKEIPDERATARIAVSEDGDGSYLLSGTDSTGLDDSVTYGWDVGNDGSYEATGSTKSVEASACGTFEVCLRTVDGDYRFDEKRITWDGSDWSDGDSDSGGA